MERIKTLFLKINKQRLVVALCIMTVCLNTQRIQSVAWNDPKMEASRLSLGALMALIIMTNYRWDDFKKYKLTYLIWTVVGGLGCVIGAVIAVQKMDAYLKPGILLLALGVFLMGYCVIHTVIHIAVEKYRPKFYKPLFIIWVVMMLWMIFSRSEYLWPESYFVMFLCYYLTEQSKDQRYNTVVGIIDGIILGFMLIQGHALLCRPYDIIRYQGNFCNPNHNCLFLCISMAAIFGKLLLLATEKKAWYVHLFYYLLLGFDYGFIFLTISRMGYLTAILLTGMYVVMLTVTRGKYRYLGVGVLLAILCALMVKPTYYAVRYIPTIHPHVVFYFQEPYSEYRVHSWDSRDSEKFISFDIFWMMVNNRKNATKKEYDTFIQGQRIMKPVILEKNHLVYSPVTIANPVQKIMKIVNPGIDVEKVPVLTQEQAGNNGLVRYAIYTWYLKHLTMRGMPYDEQGFQLTDDHWIQDTHDIYLDYGINFGIPAMVLFMIFVCWGELKLLYDAWKKKQVEKGLCSLLIVVPIFFGIFEFAWGTGLIATVAIYLAFREIVGLQ